MVCLHNWTHKQIDTKYRDMFKKWKFVEEMEFGEHKKIIFQHYGYDHEKQWFKPHIKFPSANNLDELFKEVESSIIFYGHNHLSSDITGKSRYVNLGSAGCHGWPDLSCPVLDWLRTNTPGHALP